ncbi:uncharacterized protein TRIADDRAFT_51449 [Trichoplax adhaerens]|uniref:Uncharacterized protein n=1 Tax=Trichoplax adhaerens TaxID=10228 RepID=B3RJ88_TRIAD|nr:hypothetical protein TRIADDRAFT_51449 [Trichoplax adhaerens]EDV28490.1 hypothetical protein TRIADDRAFT_51449 [Trichoplax adhaerens]|eukprot:XP_002107692.1 hypothetical protein TRIADDRAFT_51449 [Trichoplax adhaerens]
MRDIWSSNIGIITESVESEILEDDNNEDIDDLTQDITFDDLLEEIGHHDILLLYHHQHIMDQLYSEAFQKFLQRTQTSNDAHAHYNLAYFYYNGHGVAKNYNLAFYHYQLAAKQDHPGALYNICLLYGIEGNTSPQNVRFMPPDKLAEFKVTMYVRSGAQGQYTNAYSKLVDNYQQSELWQVALNKLYELYLQQIHCTDDHSDNNHEIASLYNQLGFICMVKYSANDDPSALFQANRFFHQATQLGNPSAYFNLGFFKYGFACSPDKDREKEIEMLEIAARNGHTLAQYQLGYYWRTTLKSQIENCRKSYEYFQKASVHGYSDTLCNLGFLYVNGIGGVQQDFQLAVDYFRTASVVDELACTQYAKRECFSLGFMYEHGIGVPVNLMLASHFYAYGATFQLNSKKSLCHLAKLIEKEHITPSFIRDAIELYQRAIASNNPYICGYANYRLGKIYSNLRFDGYFDEEKANCHYQIALNCYQTYPNLLGEGGADHYYHLATLYEKGYGVSIDFEKAKNYYLLSIKTAEERVDVYQDYYGQKAKRRYNAIITQIDTES